MEFDENAAIAEAQSRYLSVDVNDIHKAVSARIEFVEACRWQFEQCKAHVESLEIECILLRQACDEAYGCEEAGGIPNISLEAADTVRKERGQADGK